MAPIKKPAPSALVNIGDLDTDYSAGGGLPEGDYVLTFDVMMEPDRKDGVSRKQASRLGVLLTATPVNTTTGEPIDEPKTKFYSFGGKAHLSFAPDPNTGKGIVAIPGGAGAQPTNKSNWAYLLKSLYDSGMPKGVFTNDFTVLDNIWVHMHEVPEPEDRKSFKKSAATGEAALDTAEEPQGNGKMSIVSEIKGGVDWWEAETPATPAPKAAGPKPVVKAVAPAKKAAAPAAAEEVDVAEAAINAIGSVIEASPNGVAKLLLKTKTFTAVKEAHGDDVAQAVIDGYFGSDADLNGLLNTLGYAVTGQQVKPIPE